MTSSPSPSTENKCSDVVTDAAKISKNIDVEHVEEEDVEDEEGDMDFNPFLKEAPSVEASSSLSSEIEEFDADVVDSRENDSAVVNVPNAPDKLQDEVVENVDHNQQTVMQADSTTSYDTNTVTDVTVEDSQKVIVDSDDEDAIWRRTRARYSLVGSTLDELETFLQETDDEDDLHHNIDDEEEYRKFLTAVLYDGGSTSGAAEETENVDEDEEENDADFELELEEALESDDEILHNVSQEQEHVHAGRRPETRQKKRQKTDGRQNKFSGHTNRPLRPIFPFAPIYPKSNNFIVQSTPNPNNDHVSAFTPHQIGQLHCLMYEHLQLLVQVFSLSILEPSRQQIASQTHKLLLEMLKKRDQVVASQRIPYPRFCFDMSNICSAVTMDGGFFWVPFVSDPVLSVIDVAPLNLVQSFIDDVFIAAREHQRRKLQFTYDATVDKELLFPFEICNPSAEPTSDNATEPRKTLAGALAEKSKTQSIALVPKVIAKLALRFFLLFNPSLFPHKPPPLPVANRVLFTDSEDGLLARGLMRFNNDWNEIQKNFLPCKTPHQIFVRQKNRSCSKAPENPIKAVRRMKTSPLTPHEVAQIEEGLKVYKFDWMNVWKYVVPHRDPSLLARQWRTAVGNQKSYKADEYTKLRRRFYEQRRRQSKREGEITGAGHNREGWSTEEDVNPLPDFPRSRTLFDKENCSTDNAGGENNSGDEGGNNEDEAYVHEAFLADWRPGPSSLSSNLGENRPVEFFTQDRLTNFHPQVPANNLRDSAPKSSIRPYGTRKSSYSQVVKLAPDLPPVNLPPTVRIMSQSAFTKYQNDPPGKTRQNAVISHPRTSQQDERNSVEKNDSDLHMHPLLFQEDGSSLPYYPLNATAGSSSSFDFFPNNSSPQLNLNLFQYSHQGKHTLNFFNNSLKSKELNSSSTNVDFHPLLQRTDEGPSIPEPPAHLSTSSRTNISGVPRSPNELDLDIRLSSSKRKENERSGRVESRTIEKLPSSSHDLVEENVNEPDTVAGSLGIGNDEIVMEQEELSDSEDEEIESVEFECEEMTDSEGEGESDSDHAENVQNEDVQNDCLPEVSVHDDESDRDEPRIQETSTSNTGNEISEPSSSLRLSLNTKLPATRNSRSSSKKINLTQPKLDFETPIKKFRKRALKQEPKR